MLCPHCRTSNRLAATTCIKCGKPLGGGTGGSYADELRRQLREELGSGVDRTLGIGDEAGAIGASAAMAAPAPPPLPAAGERGFQMSHIDPSELIGMIKPEQAQLEQSARFTFASPFIQGNPVYKGRIAQTTFRYIPNGWELNAFATDQPVGVGPNDVVRPPVIIFYGGLASAIRLASAALAVYVQMPQTRAVAGSGAVLAATFNLLGQVVVASKGQFPLEAGVSIFQQAVMPMLAHRDEHVISMARTYAAAMESFIIAHESGHLSLCHTLGQRLNLDVSRNQEREADSFAASALSTSPFREYLFLGSVFTAIIFTWTEHASGHTEAGTHPLGRERFYNLLRSNSSAADECAARMGLTQQHLVELLPPA